MREIEIRWVDKDFNERIFFTKVELANNNYHAILKAVSQLLEEYETQFLEIENVEVIGY